MTKSLIHIGSKEYISFPSAAIEDIPAKVDTGADSSSVWATDIQEDKNGTLSFKLFGPGSKHYSGETLTVSKFSITQVTNSFGHKEERYKVELPVKIAGRLLTTNLTLADRSRNRYPVLIGRKTMHRRFVVDVSRDNVKALEAARRVLVLDSQPSKKIERLVEKIDTSVAGLAVDYASYDDFIIQLGGGGGLEIYNLTTESSLSEYDLIYFKTYFKAAEMAAAFVEYAQLRGINFLDSEVASYRAYTKLSQYAKLARFDISIPKSLIISHKHIEKEFDRFKELLGLPFVLKDAAADKGKSNFLIKDKAEFEQAARTAALEKAYYVGQEFIENDGDYRVLVFDKEVKFAIKRRRLDDTTHLNNTSTGAIAELIEPKDVPMDMAVLATRAALVLGREVAGVDVIKNEETGYMAILEVNNSPELAGGAYTDRKAFELGEFLLKSAEK